jgi:hypothetical protein
MSLKTQKGYLDKLRSIYLESGQEGVEGFNQ